ncbi:MAG: NigD-like protein [Prolixibacteraceae bacterium]
MKPLVKIGLIVLMAFGISSCDDFFDDDDDGYSLGDFWVGFGILHSNSQSDTDFTVEMDNGSVLIPINNYRPWDLENSDRVLINYTIVGDKKVTEDEKQYYVKVNSMSEVLYKGIFDITPAKEDSIGNDPIRVEDVWKSKNMLTLQLGFYGNVKKHYINLVKQPGTLTPESQPVQLELRHNENDDERIFNMTAFVTFDLSAIQIAGQDTVSYVVKGKKYNGDDFSFKGVYRY